MFLAVTVTEISARLVSNYTARNLTRNLQSFTIIYHNMKYSSPSVFTTLKLFVVWMSSESSYNLLYVTDLSFKSHINELMTCSKECSWIFWHLLPVTNLTQQMVCYIWEVILGTQRTGTFKNYLAVDWITICLSLCILPCEAAGFMRSWDHKIMQESHADWSKPLVVLVISWCRDLTR